MQVDDELLFLGGESPALKIGPQVVDPPEPAALAAPLQPRIPGDVAPASLAIAEHVAHQLVILLWRPQPFPQLASSNIGHVAEVGVARAVLHLRIRLSHREDTHDSSESKF